MGVPPSGALAWRYCRPHQVATEPVAGGGRQLQNASASGEVLEDGRVLYPDAFTGLLASQGTIPAWHTRWTELPELARCERME